MAGVKRSEIPAYLVRQLRTVAGPGFVDVWGPINRLSAGKESALRRYKALLTDEFLASADVKRGRQLFDRTCASCHKMHGTGGELGPDITGSNRANLDYLLDNLINPSGEIPDGYALVMVATNDGRTYSGTIAAEDDETLTMRQVGAPEDVVLAKSQVSSRVTAPVSVMPEGLLSTLKEDELRDLVGFLRK